jgi:hypothetical protein
MLLMLMKSRSGAVFGFISSDKISSIIIYTQKQSMEQGQEKAWKVTTKEAAHGISCCSISPIPVSVLPP